MEIVRNTVLRGGWKCGRRQRRRTSTGGAVERENLSDSELSCHQRALLQKHGSQVSQGDA